MLSSRRYAIAHAVPNAAARPAPAPGRGSRRPREVTALLHRAALGDRDAVNALLPVVYAELRELAACHLRAERRNHTLSPTALVHEAYLRLAGSSATHFENRAHFFAMAATVIRRVLLKHARARKAAKRGGGWRRVPLGEAEAPLEVGGVDLLALDEALNRLERIAPQKRRVVELRFFAGLEVAEVAETLGISPRQVARDWRFARAWLRTTLAEECR